MFFHNLLGAHVADPQANHWDNGRFVSACQICGRLMVKPPGAEWKIAREEPARLRTATTSRRSPPRNFGTWLLTQFNRDGWIGDLARAAKADRRFPRDGDPDMVRKHLSDNQAESDMLEAVDNAENIWLCL